MLRAMLLFVVAVALAGCASATTTTDGTDPFPPTTQVESLTLPFDAYTLSLANIYTILNAEDVLMHKCMKAHGYDFDVIDRPTGLKDLRNRRRYGVIEPVIAQFGYHVPAGLLTPVDVDLASNARDTSLNEGAKATLFGPQGCGAKAADQIGPGDDADLNRLEQMNSASLQDSEKGPGVTELMISWRNCMHRKGLEYSNPLAAMSDPKWWSANDPAPSSQEITVATADVDCKGQTGLIDAWHAAEVRIQQDEINQDPAYFRMIRAELNKQLDNAKTVH